MKCRGRDSARPCSRAAFNKHQLHQSHSKADIQESLLAGNERPTHTKKKGKKSEVPFWAKTKSLGTCMIWYMYMCI